VYPTKVTLDGAVSPERLSLYRDRGGRNLYLRFEGKVVSRGEASVLKGHMVKQPLGFIGYYVGLMFFIAAAAILIPPFNWRGLESIVAIGIGLAAGALGLFILWFRRKNVEAEAQLLSKDIEEALRGPGV